jgi:hypothetical protein
MGELLHSTVTQLNGRWCVKIIAFDNFKPGVTLDDLKPLLREEVSNVWRLWKAGIVCENYARADVGGENALQWPLLRRERRACVWHSPGTSRSRAGGWE